MILVSTLNCSTLSVWEGDFQKATLELLIVVFSWYFYCIFLHSDGVLIMFGGIFVVECYSC